MLGNSSYADRTIIRYWNCNRVECEDLSTHKTRFKSLNSFFVDRPKAVLLLPFLFKYSFCFRHIAVFQRAHGVIQCHVNVDVNVTLYKHRDVPVAVV